MNARVVCGLGCLVVAVACGSTEPSSTGTTSGGDGGASAATVSATIVASSSGDGTTGSGTTGSGTTSGPPSSSTGMVTDCHVFAADPCADCAENDCCAEIIDCANDDACFACLTDDPSGPGCSANTNLDAFFGCIVDNCGEEYDLEGGYVGNACNVVPAGWTCPDDQYNSSYYGDPNATCECYACGVFDPDCYGGAPDDAACPGGFCTNHCGCVPDGSACQ